MEALIPIVMFLSIAAVMILRPLTKKLGHIMEQVARDRRVNRDDQSEIARLQLEVEHLAKRLDLMEERADFTERLVGASRSMQSLTREHVATTRHSPAHGPDMHTPLNSVQSPTSTSGSAT